ncbi:c-type cytochrome [Stakelama tenebrarum]|uniref:C-type cytochrome n=1 Tax=Stakelama tenebrarum TaxID=2711215 RepID=A0A6G6Y329_9SPHN|nr:c-type cytochrome [Sphingosinithalassobacter tenebrarum]QIG79354.1 c-type cytochrome [Sphingosinithalassobacter tenebrarum]
MTVLAALAACKPPPQSRHIGDQSTMARGKQVIAQAGCGACHEIPGVAWPRGKLGPSLMNYDDIGFIAGSRPASIATLATFVRDPRSVRPDSTMPAMPISEADARAVATYLYGQDDD